MHPLNSNLLHSGSLFSIVASAQVFSSVASTAFYPNVFPLTLRLGLRPGTSYLIMAAMCAVPAPLLMYAVHAAPTHCMPPLNIILTSQPFVVAVCY